MVTDCFDRNCLSVTSMVASAPATFAFRAAASQAPGTPATLEARSNSLTIFG